MWKKIPLSTSTNVIDIGFVGRGSIFVEGSFGGGTIQVKLKTDTGQLSTGFAYELDGADLSSVDVPSGLYRFELVGSTGATVDIWYNDQVDLIRGS